jgi:hypothetical protein
MATGPAENSRDRQPPDGSSSDAATARSPATGLRRPPSSVASLGVLTDRPEAELEALLARDAIATLIEPKYCGDERACDAVRTTLRNEQATALHVMPAADWTLGHIDVDASTGSLSPTERASISSRHRVVVVQVATVTSPRQLAVRAAFAAAAAIAERTGGLVHDPLLSRLETPRDFAMHAVTDPLEASAFRRDRVEVLYEPKEEGMVRVLTAGLARWGAPDVEAARVPTAASERVAELVLAVADAIANGKQVGSQVVLSRDDIGRSRGEDYPQEGFPPPVPVAIDLVSVAPEGGDPNDFIARIEPPAGESPMGYIELAERFFGPLLTVSPDLMQKRRAEATRLLATALARWGALRAGGAKLLVQLPFAIPGDAGIESMWVDVTRYDARTVTGRIVDEPLGATDVSRGDRITRPREEVEDLRQVPAE